MQHHWYARLRLRGRPILQKVYGGQFHLTAQMAKPMAHTELSGHAKDAHLSIGLDDGKDFGLG